MNIKNMMACAPLLPPPGDAVVIDLCEAYAALEREKAELAAENAELKQNMKAVNDYLQPNWSNDMPWYDEIIIAIDQRHWELIERVKELEAENAALRKRLEPSWTASGDDVGSFDNSFEQVVSKKEDEK